jgi:transposase
MSKQKKSFNETFKRQIVNLFKSGKSVGDISKEYDIGYSTVYKWIKANNNSGSFKAKDNRTEEENELIKLRKRNRQLEMEVDILKQAALIMGQKKH